MKKLYLSFLLGASVLLFYCQKSAPLAYLPPTVRTAAAQAAPASSFVLSGQATPHPGASLAYYYWSQVAGPHTLVIADPGKPSTTVTGAVPGTYVFELFATDNKGATGSAYDTVTVGYNPSFFSMR